MVRITFPVIATNEFAFQDRRLVHILEPKSGSFSCPYCHQRVIPRPGAFPPHFAHWRRNPNCKRPPGESDLHALAKALLAQCGHVWAPDRKKPIVLEHIRLEYPLSNFVFDLIAKDGEGRDMVVEFAVDHASSSAKVDFLRQNSIAALEIDLRQAVSPTQLEQWILKSSPRRWMAKPRFQTGVSITHQRNTYRQYPTVWGPYTILRLEEELNELRIHYGPLREAIFLGVLQPTPDILHGQIPKSSAFVQSNRLPAFYHHFAWLPGLTLRKRDWNRKVQFRLAPEPRGFLYLPYLKRGVYFPEVTDWHFT